MEQEPKYNQPTVSLAITIETLEGLDSQYKDNIPDEMISGKSTDREWKVRRNWWQGCISTLDAAKEHLDPIKYAELIRKIEQFNQEYTDGTFTDRAKTTESDIAKANEIMKEVVVALKNLQDSI